MENVNEDLLKNVKLRLTLIEALKKVAKASSSPKPYLEAAEKEIREIFNLIEALGPEEIS